MQKGISYEPLARSKKVRETEKAVLISWQPPVKWVEDEHPIETWIPKSLLFQNSHGVWCAAEWLVQKLHKEHGID